MPYTNPPDTRAAGQAGHIADHNSIAGDLVTLESHVADGLTGATAAYRMAGGTASGAPVSGTFALGDVVVAQNGHLFVCTTAGSPGTWIDAGTAGGITIDATTGDIQASPGTAAAGNQGQAADAKHVHPSPATFSPTGNTGATAASRYAGATASGHPTTGTYSTGDYTVDQTGSFWICSAGGTPGTWIQVIAGSVSGGTVNSVTAGDTSIVVGGTATNPTVATGTLDVIAADHPPAANWSNNSKKITSLANGSASSDAAAYGQILPIAGGTMTGALAPAVVALTDAATIAVNAALGNDFRVTIAGNRTLGSPSNPVDGQRIIFQVTQDGSGNRTLAYGAAYEFSTSLPVPTLSPGANLTDLLGFIYNAAKGTWLFVAFVSGFS